MSLNRETITKVLRSIRIHDSLEAKGVSFGNERKEDWSKVGFTSNGMLGRHGDKIGISYRFEVSGKPTYHLRDLLKSNGFRFDWKGKVWFKKNVECSDFLAASMLRELAR